MASGLAPSRLGPEHWGARDVSSGARPINTGHWLDRRTSRQCCSVHALPDKHANPEAII
jgi:hypothetical protein